jgi:hypothetical protein
LRRKNAQKSAVMHSPRFCRKAAEIEAADRTRTGCAVPGAEAEFSRNTA